MAQRELLIIPCYLNCNQWERDFEALDELVNYVFEIDRDVIILGDMNARVGTRQVICSEMEVDTDKYAVQRRSKDQSANGRGSRFLELLEEHQLLILNGRSRGDAEGELTFIGGNGVSTIDYCCATPGAMKLIEDFWVGRENFSDHMPIVLALALGTQQRDAWLPYLPKLPWRVSCKKKYQKCLEKQVLGRWEGDVSIEREADWIVAAITQAANEASMRYSGGSVPAKPWWDWDCTRARDRSFASLRLFRRLREGLRRLKGYVKANTDYKTLQM